MRNTDDCANVFSMKCGNLILQDFTEVADEQGSAELTTPQQLTKIEANINSRPLLALSNDPDNMQTLTPAHFHSS